MQKIKNDLEISFVNLHRWFHDDTMVTDFAKCLYIVIGDDDPSHIIILNND